MTCPVVSSRKILNEVRPSARTLSVSNTALHTYSYLRVALHIVWKNNDMDEKWPGSRVLIGQGSRSFLAGFTNEEMNFFDRRKNFFNLVVQPYIERLIIPVFRHQDVA